MATLVAIAYDDEATAEAARQTVQQLEADMPASTTVVGRFGPRSRVRQGDQIEAAIDTRALHFFDPETGLGIYD
jgi:multiple sugar transport system ATP-binding protein